MPQAITQQHLRKDSTAVTRLAWTPSRCLQISIRKGLRRKRTWMRDCVILAPFSPRFERVKKCVRILEETMQKKVIF